MLLIQENGESYAYSCQEQTKFTILTKLLDPLVSNIKGFFLKNCSFSPIHLYGVILQKFMFLTHEKAEG
jgi:hypothetical protein